MYNPNYNVQSELVLLESRLVMNIYLKFSGHVRLFRTRFEWCLNSLSGLCDITYVAVGQWLSEYFCRDGVFISLHKEGLIIGYQQ